MKAILMFALVMASYIPAFAACTEEWFDRYNGTGNSIDESQSIVVDNAGNVYITGYSSPGGGPDFNYITRKYNSSGVLQWTAPYNGPANGEDQAKAIVVDFAGNVYVTGHSAGMTSGFDYATIKYNSAGVQQWVARYNGPGNGTDFGMDLKVDFSGNVYVTGQSSGSGTGSDYATVKYNSAGIQQWDARYNYMSNYADGAVSIAIDNSGNCYVTGSSRSGNNLSDADYATVKYNSSGVQQWVSRYNGAGNDRDEARTIVVDQGNVYVTGSATGTGSFNDYATIKYNNSGTQQWIAIYNGTGNNTDIAYSMALDFFGNVFVTGSSILAGGSFPDYATIKYNSAGVQQWLATYDGPGAAADNAFSIAIQDTTGNIYVTGNSHGISTSSDFATIKYNSAGVQQCLMRYDGPANNNDISRDIAVDHSGNIYVTGYSVGTLPFSDYYTIKYNQTVGIQTISAEVPEKFKLFQNYPNPFNPVTRIRFEIVSFEFTSLKIFDIKGREIHTILNERLRPGTYEASFDGNELPGGVYFYRIKTGNYIETKKMMLVK